MPRFAFALCLFACHTSPPPSVAVNTADATTLGPGDVFEVRVYQEADLSGVYRVSSDGTIDFPLLGRVIVAGKTASDTALLLRDRLQKDFIRKPQVSVLVKEYNSKKVFVLGYVMRPGAYAYTESMDIVNAIAQAGGFAKGASPNATHVTRVLNDKETRIPVHVESIGKGQERNFPLAPGDIVFVPESIF